MKRVFPFLFAICLMLTGCGGGESSSELPTELVVSGGSEHQETEEAALFPFEINGTEVKEEAKRVVSLSPAVTEIIAELGYSDKLCGISSYCDHPEGLEVQTVGSAENPDMDILAGLAPDVLFTISPLSERDVYALEDIGTAVIFLEVPASVEDYGRLYSDIASVFVGVEAAAKESDVAVKALEDKAAGAFSGTYIYVTPKMTAAGAGTIENAVLSLCGENICTGEGYCMLSDIGEVQPDVIIAGDELTADDINADEVLSALVNNGAKVVYVPSVRFERPSARISEVFDVIREQLSK